MNTEGKGLPVADMNQVKGKEKSPPLDQSGGLLTIELLSALHKNSTGRGFYVSTGFGSLFSEAASVSSFAKMAA